MLALCNMSSSSLFMKIGSDNRLSNVSSLQNESVFQESAGLPHQQYIPLALAQDAILKVGLFISTNQLFIL